MKLTFKDLKQQKFQIDAEPSDTILRLKEKIQEEKGWDVATQKLIYSGKILKDADTVEHYKIEEKGFVVCMVSKPKAPPAPAAAAKVPETPSKPPPVSTPAAPQAASSSAPRDEAPATPTPQGSSQPPAPAANINNPSTLALGSQREAAINGMLEMGYERPQIEAAMRAAFNNPDRAVEYLLTGIPENLQREQAPAPATQPQTQADAPAGGETAEQPAAPAAAAGGNVNLFAAAAEAAQRQQQQARPAAGAGGLGNLEFLRNNPQFQQLRNAVQQNPQMLEPILQQVAQGNPQLAGIIAQNPEAFLNLLGEGVDDEEGGFGGAGGVPPGGQAIHVTEEERDAIERLCGLGFSRDLVIQAYFACDKNEELAANFLFENGMDED